MNSHIAHSSRRHAICQGVVDENSLFGNDSRCISDIFEYFSLRFGKVNLVGKKQLLEKFPASDVVAVEEIRRALLPMNIVGIAQQEQPVLA